MPKKGEVNFSPEEIKREKIKKLNDALVLEANRADQLKKKYNAQKKYDPYDVLKKEVDAFKTDPRSVKIMDHAKNTKIEIDDSKKVFGGTMSFEEFGKFLDKINIGFNGIDQKDNNIVRALFTLLLADEDGAANDIIKNCAACRNFVQIQRVYRGALLAVEGREGELTGELKKAYDLIKDCQANSYELVDVHMSYSMAYMYVKQFEKNKETNSFRDGILSSDKKARDDFKKQAAEYKPGDPLSVKVFTTDFIELVDALTVSRWKEYGVDERSVLEHVSKLKTDEERMEYFQQLLDMGSHPMCWEYSPGLIDVLTPEIRNSGNLEEVKTYYMKNHEKLDIRTKAIVLKRIYALQKSKKLLESKELPDNKDFVINENGTTVIGQKFQKAQSSGNGCWSCGILLQLKTHGIDVDEEDIRAFRPDLNSELKNNFLIDNYYSEDHPKDITEMADSVLAFAPNRMLRYFEITKPGTAQPYFGAMERINYDKYLKAATKAAAKKIKQIIEDEKTVASFTTGGHYYTIAAIEGDYILCRDSATGGKVTRKLESILDTVFSGKASEYGPIDFRISWLSKMELASDNKTLLNVPSHYLSVNEDGTYNMPPDLVQKENDQEKTKFEQNGFRVKLIGGVDDIAYDRIKRNPLDKDNLLIYEYAYMPKKFDIEVLKKRAKDRDKNYTKLLEKRREELLGKNFKPPVHNLSEKDMDIAVKDHDVGKRCFDLTMEFMDSIGLYNLNPKDLKNSKGKEFLYYKPGAIVAYRLEKAYKAIEALAPYMIEHLQDQQYKDKWIQGIDDFKKDYAKLMKKISLPENAITSEIKPDIYTLPGYFKNERDIGEALMLLYHISDRINLEEFDAKRYKFVKGMDYDPSILSRFGENIKEFADANQKCNILKLASENKMIANSVDYMLTMPSTNPELLNQKLLNNKDQKLRDYINFSCDMTDVIMNGDSSKLMGLKIPAPIGNIKPVSKSETKFKGKITNEFNNAPVNDIDVDNINEIIEQLQLEANEENNTKISEEGKKEIKDDKDIKPQKSNSITRSIKRRDQYEAFLASVKGQDMNNRDKGLFKDFTKLLDDITPYLEPGQNKKMSYDQLSSIVDRYKKLEVSFDNNVNSVFFRSELYKKFRLVMSKDFKTFLDVLKKNEKLSADEKKKARFSLVDIFEESRSITISMDEDKLEKSGGNLSQRIRINTTDSDGKKLDGYFTIHEEPFDRDKSLHELAEKFAGGDDSLLIYFGEYLLRDWGKDVSQTKKLQASLSYPAKKNDIHAKYDSPEKLLEAFTGAFDEDIKTFAERREYGEDSPEMKKLLAFKAKYTADHDACENLLDYLRGSYLIRSRDIINHNMGINGFSKVDKRNSAMSAVAELLGIGDCIASSKNMRLKLGDKIYKGTFMENAKGAPLHQVGIDTDYFRITDEQLEGSPELIKSIANLQILDLLCGNPDRHSGNYSYIIGDKVDKNGRAVKKLLGIQGYDNDTSFGYNYNYLQYDRMSAIPFDHMRIIPEETAKRILALDKDTLRTILIGYDLSSHEIDVTIDRLTSIQTKITESYDYYKKKPAATLSNNVVKIVTDDEIGKLSFKKDLCVEKEENQKDYNLFSRVYNVFAFQNGVDPARTLNEKKLLKDEKLIGYDIILNRDMALIDIVDIKKAGFDSDKDIKEVLDLSAEPLKMRDAAEYKVFSGDLFVEKPTYNDNIKTFCDNSKTLLDKCKLLVEKKEKALSGLDKTSEAYKKADNELLLIKSLYGHLEKLDKTYEKRGELIEYHGKVLKLVEDRRNIYEGKNIEKVDKSKDIKPEIKEVKKGIPEIKEPKKEEPPVKEEKKKDTEEINTSKKDDDGVDFDEEDRVFENYRAERLIEEVDNLEDCQKGICEKLKAIRAHLKTKGQKTDGILDYRKDGTDKYKNMAYALEDVINALSEGGYNIQPVEIMRKIKTLEKASVEYYDSHYGVFGVPGHGYGRARLEDSLKLCEEVSAAKLTYVRVRTRLNNLELGYKYGDESLTKLRLRKTKLVKKLGINEDKLLMKGYQYEKRISDAQVNAYRKLKRTNDKIYKLYNRKNPDACLDIIKNKKKTLAKSTRAQIYVLHNFIESMFKNDITPEQAEETLNKFTTSKCKDLTSQLADSSLFDNVQKVCYKKEPDMGITVWSMIEKKADTLKREIKDELTKLGGFDRRIQNMVDKYKPANDTEEAKDAAMREVCKEGAKILVREALLSESGRRILRMMAIEDSRDKLDAMTERATEYLLRKKSFVPGKNETMFNKIDSVLGQKLAADVLQDFKKSGPKLDMTKFNVNIPEDPAKTTSVKKQAKTVDPGMGPK